MAFAPPLFYPLLDASILPDKLESRDALLRALLKDLTAGGVTLLQYRNKQGSDQEIIADCAILRGALTGGGAARQCTLILNDRADLVAATSFDGVHIGQQDMSPAEARALIGPNRILGVSTHNEDQLRQAAQTTADYIAIGPVFATSTKGNPDPVVGLDGVRRARALTSKPLVAIGGITLGNCRSVRDAGADSVAVISSLFGVPSNPSPRHSLEKTARDFFVELR